MGEGPAIFLLGSSALPLAERLKSVLGGEIHGPQSITEADQNYSKAAAALQSLFNHGEPIIGLFLERTRDIRTAGCRLIAASTSSG